MGHSLESHQTPVFGISRRALVASVPAAALGGLSAETRAARAAIVRTDLGGLPPYGNGTLPSAIRSRVVKNVNGLDVHLLESGFEGSGRPAILLLHGFPELAYSWRKLMLPLASSGYHVIAPDRRGFGRTTGWDDAYDTDLHSFGMLQYVRDALGLVSALGYRSVAAVVGHDAGAPHAAWCSLVRPDVFRSVVLMSAPFAGTPVIPFNSANEATTPRPPATIDEIDAELAKLTPPRKHYLNYYRTREANSNMMNAPQGLKAFFRAYYHYKSADWSGNNPFPLKSRTAGEMAKMPTYYVMDFTKGMAETAAAEMPTPAQIAECKWLTDDELAVYVTEYSRTGFQGGLQGYRRLGDSRNVAELRTFSGRTIDVPSAFISGKSDWGNYQSPGAIETMRTKACTQMTLFHLIDGAGHWVQQERPEEVVGLLQQFIRP